MKDIPPTILALKKHSKSVSGLYQAASVFNMECEPGMETSIRIEDETTFTLDELQEAEKLQKWLNDVIKYLRSKRKGKSK